MTKRPKEKLAYLKFFPTDWRSDPRLRMCSVAARGLWVEMMCLMHEAEPYGHLIVSGQRPTDAQLAVLAGAPSDQIPDLLGELESAGVFSRTAQGVIYSRRMTRDEKKRRIARKNGKSGGNPSLGQQKENPALDNPQVKGGDKTQSPESRVQSPEKTRKPPSGQEAAGDLLSMNGAEPKGPPPFDEWWKVYPRKANKGGAERAFKAALKKASLETLTTAARNYAESCKAQGTEEKYIAHASTWLNQERWNDWLQSQTSGNDYGPGYRVVAGTLIRDRSASNG